MQEWNPPVKMTTTAVQAAASFGEYIVQQEAEIERLRAALEEIAKEKRYPSHCAGIDCKRIARAALAKTKTYSKA